MGHSFLLYNYFIFFFFQSNRFLVNTRNAINSLWEHNTICPRSVTTLNWGLAGHTKRPKPEQKLNASAILGSIKRSVCRFMFVHLEYAQHSTAEKTIWLTWLYFVHWARSLFPVLLYLFTDIQSIAVALANWRATTADATATTEIVNKHDATRLEAAVQLCSLYWFSAFFFHYQCLRHPRFAPALLAFCFGQLAMGRTRTRMRHDVSVVMVMRSMPKQRAHSNWFLSESSFHNYRNKHCVWRVWVACNPFVDLRQPAKFQILAISIRRLVAAGFKLPTRGWDETDNMC